MKQIYLDYNATTPVDPEVALEMKPYIDELFGNPSSSHAFGVKARLGVETARSRVASLLGCSSEEIIFTSGGTESNNMAVKGVMFAHRSRGNHLIISAVEHPAVAEVANFLSRQGFEVSVAEVDRFGMVDPEEVRRLIRPDTVLISIMHANNEVGTVQPIAEISAIAREYGILLHTDAAQSTGKIRVGVNELGVDLLSVAGHKLYAPKGIGALYIRKGVTLEKLMHGAGHEQDMRAGTENVPEIAGLGKACEIAGKGLETYRKHTFSLKQIFLRILRDNNVDFHVHGHPEQCLPNTLSVGFRNLDAGTILSALPALAASAGAACHAVTQSGSSVLGAMKADPAYSAGTIRFSFGRYSTEAEVKEAAGQLVETLRKLNAVSSRQSVAAVADGKVRLTEYTHGMGCACKIRPADLEKVLVNLPPVMDPNVLVGADKRDDAAVYRINAEVALVQTVDFFTPVVDDPCLFGAIAAANALSDVYAMGAIPAFALNIAAFPVNRLPLSVMQEIMKGASEKAKEAGIHILGGHSIEDNEPKFGMVVSGFVHPGKVLTNAGAKPGDRLLLTKPLGTGIISTAVKMGLAGKDSETEAGQVMAALNKTAAELMRLYDVNACTDVTGFGLAGHLHEMALASGVDVHIQFNRIPLIPGVAAMAAAGAVPGGSRANLAFAAEWTSFGDLSTTDRLILCDAQTSGGLLISLPEIQAEALEKSMISAGILCAQIGYVEGDGKGNITVKYNG